MIQNDTKERILDAAERLIASDGFHRTSLRAITTAAGVNLASVNYHFGSKEALMEAVIDRRLLPLNCSRREGLEEIRERARQQGRRPRVREALRAFIEPTLRFRESGDGAQAFVTLVGRAMAEPDDTLRRTFLKRMEPVASSLFEILSEALPSLPRETLYWRLHFALGAMSHTLCLSGRNVFPAGLTPPTDSAALTDLLLDFLVPGLEVA